MSRPEVIVVGAGIVGACVALRLAQGGARVTVLDASRPAAGTSAASFAWINAFAKPPRAYHDLSAAGMAEHGALAAELDGRWLHRVGNLKWEEIPERQAQLRATIGRLRDWGYPVEELTPAQAGRLEPELVIAPLVDLVAHAPEEGWVEVVPLVAGALAGALRAGGRILTGRRVVGIRLSSGRVGGVVTDPGGELGADIVVDCAGPAAAEVARLADVNVATGQEPGRLVYTAPVATTLRRLVHAPGVHFRPDGGGRVVLADEAGDLVVDSRPARPGGWTPEQSVASAARYLPALGGAPVEAVRVGVRPMPADRLPALGPVPGVQGFYLVVSHSGVTMGPLWGRLAAAEILSGVPEPRLDPFRPARLIEVVATPVAGPVASRR